MEEGLQLIPVPSVDFRIWVILLNARGIVMVVLGQVQACAGWMARTESRTVYRLGLHLWRVRGMASMIGTGTAFTLKYILPRVLLVVPVSCQDFSILFDVVSGA